MALLLAPPTFAQDDSGGRGSENESKSTPQKPGSAKPWAKDVSGADQAAALKSFKLGNEFFGQRQYAEALKHYKKALKFWKHPAIHFNTAVCQVNLDQPIAAFDNIKAALEFKDAPLGEDLYAQGLTYKKLLSDRLGHLTVKVKNSDTRVTLDGKDLLVGPGEVAQVLLPGKHQLVGEAKGFLTYTKAVQVDAGTPSVVEVKMIPLDEATEFERPMATWLPWTVMGGGALLGLAGWGMRATATAKLQRYDDYVDSNCPSGCTDDQLPDDIKKSLSSSEVWDVASIATMSVGGAAVLTGVTLLILNSPRPVQPKEQGPVAYKPRFQPLFAPGHAELHMRMAF